MGGESPVVEIYDSAGNPLAVQNGVAIPASTPALMIAGSDGTNSRYMLIDSSGRPVIVGAGTAGSPAGGVVSIQGVASGTVVPISGTIAATQNGNIDAGNSSTVTLAGSGTFTGTGIDVSVYGVVSVFVFTDQAGTLNLEWSINGTNWDDVNSYAVSASTALSIQFGPQARFFRVVYQNGGSAQGTFRLQTIERPITAFPETVPASYTIQNSDNVLLTKTVQGTSPWVTNITQFGGNNVVTGTGAGGVGIPRVTVSNDSNVLVTQSTSPWVTNITQFGGNNVVTGTGAGGVGIPRVTVSNDSNILATQSGSWTVTANQGTPNSNANKWPVQVTDGTNNMPTGDAVGRAIFEKITDGTNTAAVKAGSTAAAAADPSLVTAFSPNSPLPTGSNVIGAVTQSSGPWTENLTQIAGSAVSTAATGVQKVGIVGGAGTSLETTAGVVDHNLKNVANSAVATAATGVQKVGIVGSTGTSLDSSTAGVVDANIKNIGNSAVATLAAGEQKVAVEGLAANGAATSGNPVLVAGYDGTNARTIFADPQGDVYTTDFGAPSNSLRGMTVGLVTGTSGTLSAVRATTYTEQTTNAQRSVSSSSTNDTSAGTGARQVKITYYDQTGAGPSTETVTLSGTTAVNTVSSTICFIEKMEVVSVGSNKSNVGTITLFTTTGGGGTAIGTIGTANIVSGRGDNQTFWAHHYVATGKTCNITSYQGGTAANQGTLTFLMSVDPTSATSAEKVVTDITAFSASTESVTRLIRVPIRIAGPARITEYVVPSGSNTKFTGGFDFWEL